MGPATVIVKLGEQGVALTHCRRIAVLRAPTVTAVDSTAAGDIFNAALAVALTRWRRNRGSLPFRKSRGGAVGDSPRSAIVRTNPRGSGCFPS